MEVSKYFEFFKGKKRIFPKLLRMMPKALKNYVSDRGMEISIHLFFLTKKVQLQYGKLFDAKHPHQPKNIIRFYIFLFAILKDLHIV